MKCDSFNDALKKAFPVSGIKATSWRKGDPLFPDPYPGVTGAARDAAITARRAKNPVYRFVDAMMVEQAREIQSWESGQRGIADECVKRGWIPADWNFWWSGEQIEFQADDLQGPEREP